MGYNPIFKSQWQPFIILLVSTTTTSSTPFPQPLPSPPRSAPHNYALKPSMTIIIGALTTVFSITFLLLLYAKHCRRSNNRYPPSELTAVRFSDRDNSGIDRTIIESLPVFRFGSLTGQKDGLECAVCLSVFNQSEVLRLLPKCKHAFHVECVDTWLDAHSTCPLCRYRVDPEDIFLILEENKNQSELDKKVEAQEVQDERELPVRRVSGRHSSAGEQGSNRQVFVVTSSPVHVQTTTTAQVTTSVVPVSSRRSLDSWNNNKSSNCLKKTKKTKKKDATPSVKTVSGTRKDGLLLADTEAEAEEEERRRRYEKRFEHRIVVGTSGAERWSDVQPSDLLYLRSEMILSDVRRLKRSRPSVLHEGNNGWWQSGRGVINSRSVSEMTGLSRFGSSGEAGVVSRLLARLSEPRSGRNSSSSNV
ncbi:putative transcription factor C2H2 family [Helianthus annuus]|nr:putative transcription factor C2H2 family [Helianthus annuus]